MGKIYPGSPSPSAPILQESKELNGAHIDIPVDPARRAAPLSHPPPDRRHRRRSRLSCCCCLLAHIAAIIILLGIVVLVFWLVLRPIHLPKYNVQDVSVSQLQVNPANSTVTSLINFSVRAENPNKKIGIYYDRISIFARYGTAQVAQGGVPPFYQGHRNVTVLTSALVASSAPITSDDAVRLRSDIASGSVPLDVLVRVRARIRAGRAKSPRFTVRDTCRIHVSPPTAPGGARLLDKSCKVKVRL